MSEHSEQTEHIKVVIPEKGLNDNQKRFLSLFGESMCCVSTTCLNANIGRTIFYDWMKDNQVFAETIMNIREGLIDFVEVKLYKSIVSGELTAMIFFLKTQGKGRGWSERFDVDLEKGTTKLFQSADDKKLIAETRKKLALLDLLLVTDDRDKKMKMLEEFKK